jgi:hypothetical protein
VAESFFVGYVGDPDFHDGQVMTVEQFGSKANVRVRGASGAIFFVEFGGVQATRAACPEGMMIYALSEFSYKLPIKRFVFANWEDDGEAYLEIDAESISFHQE